MARLFHFALRQPVVQTPSRFPAVVRDFSYIFADTVSWLQISNSLLALNISGMRAPEPLEIFRDPKGKTIPRGSYSILLRTVFQSQDRTLREEEIQAGSDQVMAALAALGGVIRDGAGAPASTTV